MKKIISFLIVVTMLLMTVQSVFAVSADTVTDKLIGDVDMDGTVTAKDARIALRLAVNIGEEIDSIELADVNSDGTVGTDDARAILRISVGLEETQKKDPASEIYILPEITLADIKDIELTKEEIAEFDEANARYDYDFYQEHINDLNYAAYLFLEMSGIIY